MKPLIVHALESLLLTTCMWKTHVPRRLIIEDPPPLPSVMPHGSLLQALPVVTLLIAKSYGLNPFFFLRTLLKLASGKCHYNYTVFGRFILFNDKASVQ